MTRRLFLKALRFRISDLSEAEINERINFYNEIIDDKIEEGLTEDEAINEIGTPDEIAYQIRADLSASGIESATSNDSSASAKELAQSSSTRSPASQRVTQAVLILLGSPVWFSIVVSVFAVMLSAVVSLWAVVISLWASCAALGGGVFYGIGSSALGTGIGFSQRLLYAGTALISAGLSILLFLGAKVATRGTVVLTYKIYELTKGFCVLIKNVITGKRGLH